MAEKGLPKIGIDMVHMALVTSDQADDAANSIVGEYLHSIPERIFGAVSVSFTPDQSTETFYADNGPYVTAKSTMAISLEFEMADVPLEVLGKYFGGTYVDGLYQPLADLDPEVAIMYRLKMSNGHYRYFRFYKGKATLPDMSGNTQAESVDFGSTSFTYTGEVRQFDGQPFAIIDTDDPKLPTGITKEVIEKNWFTDINWTPADGAVVKHNVTVKSDNLTEGSVSASPTGPQKSGEQITLTATPESGFTFDHWDSDNGGTFASTTSASTTFTTPANDVVITAFFS